MATTYNSERREETNQNEGKRETTTKIVIVGSCRFEPYLILDRPVKVKGKWNTEEGYQIRAKTFLKHIDSCDEVWLYIPDGIGEHSRRDLQHAIQRGKKIMLIKEIERDSPAWIYLGLNKREAEEDKKQ